MNIGEYFLDALKDVYDYLKSINQINIFFQVFFKLSDEQKRVINTSFIQITDSSIFFDAFFHYQLTVSNEPQHFARLLKLSASFQERPADFQNIFNSLHSNLAQITLDNLEDWLPATEEETIIQEPSRKSERKSFWGRESMQNAVIPSPALPATKLKLFDGDGDYLPLLRKMEYESIYYRVFDIIEQIDQEDLNRLCSINQGLFFEIYSGFDAIKKEKILNHFSFNNNTIKDNKYFFSLRFLEKLLLDSRCDSKDKQIVESLLQLYLRFVTWSLVAKKLNTNLFYQSLKIIDSSEHLIGKERSVIAENILLNIQAYWGKACISKHKKNDSALKDTDIDAGMQSMLAEKNEHNKALQGNSKNVLDEIANNNALCFVLACYLCQVPANGFTFTEVKTTYSFFNELRDHRNQNFREHLKKILIHCPAAAGSLGDVIIRKTSPNQKWQSRSGRLVDQEINKLKDRKGELSDSPYKLTPDHFDHLSCTAEYNNVLPKKGWSAARFNVATSFKKSPSDTSIETHTTSESMSRVSSSGIIASDSPLSSVRNRKAFIISYEENGIKNYSDGTWEAEMKF